jgi:hypothetical protein
MQVKANIGSHARGEIALFLIGIVYVPEKGGLARKATF